MENNHIYIDCQFDRFYNQLVDEQLDTPVKNY